MPFTDLPLDQLRPFEDPTTEPGDFDTFWADTLADARRHGSDFTLEPADTPYTAVQVWDLTYPGYSGEPIRAWVVRPASGVCRGTVVEYIGYGGGRGLPGERPHWALAGYMHIIMDSRGQAGSWGSGGNTPDPHGPLSTAGGPITRGIENPETYYYRRFYTDAVRLIDIVDKLPFPDRGRLFATGHSQGGGTTLAVAGLAKGLAGVLPDVAFLCAIRRAVELTPTEPYREIARYLSVHTDRVDQVFDTLSYFDGVSFARRATAPALFSVALMDDIVLPSTVFAAFNAYAHPAKSIEVYQFNGHEGGGLRHQYRQARWAAAIGWPQEGTVHSVAVDVIAQGSTSEDPDRWRHSHGHVMLTCMSVHDLIDLEARIPLDELKRAIPGGLNSIHDITQRRAAMTDMTAAIEAPPNPNVTISDRTVPGPVDAPDIALRIYRPAHTQVPVLPGVYFIHGGGMILGAAAGEDASAALICERVGALVVSVEYRLAPENPYPAPVDDCYAGLVWMARNAAELGFDPQRIAIYGGSAGGGLAIATAMTARDRGFPTLRFQMPIYPMIDNRNDTASSREIVDVGIWDRSANIEAWDWYLAGREPDQYAAPARATYLAGLPPTFIDVGTVDLFRDEDITFAARLMQAGVPTELHVNPGAYHAAEVFAPNTALAKRIWDHRIEALIRALQQE